MKWFIKQFRGWPDRWPEIKCTHKWFKLAIYKINNTLGKKIVIEINDLNDYTKVSIALDKQSTIELGRLLIGIAEELK